jgi:hypothetical protein
MAMTDDEKSEREGLSRRKPLECMAWARIIGVA